MGNFSYSITVLEPLPEAVLSAEVVAPEEAEPAVVSAEVDWLDEPHPVREIMAPAMQSAVRHFRFFFIMFFSSC